MNYCIIILKNEVVNKRLIQENSGFIKRCELRKWHVEPEIDVSFFFFWNPAVRWVRYNPKEIIKVLTLPFWVNAHLLSEKTCQRPISLIKSTQSKKVVNPPDQKNDFWKVFEKQLYWTRMKVL